MGGRRLFIKVGDEPLRGPLDENAVRASLESGVLDDKTLAGESEDGLAPIHEVLARPNAKSPNRIPKIGFATAGLLFVAGIATATVFYVKNRPPPLCEATPKILARLDPARQATIKLYVTTPAPKKLEEARQRVEGLLARMAAESKGTLSYEVIEITGDTRKKEALEAGIQADMYSGDTKGAGNLTTFFFGLAFSYGDERDRLAALGIDSDVQTAEFFIINKVREISAKADKRSSRIAIAAGHGGIEIGDSNLVPPQGAGKTPSIRGIVNQFFPYYTLDDVDLTKAEVPQDAVGLLVTQPDKPYDDAELAKIDEHVMRGGALAIIASAAHAERDDPRVHVKLDTRGLEKLTAGYGLELGRDVVYETGTRYRVSAHTPSGAKTVELDWIPAVRDDAGLDTQSPLFIRLPEVFFPLASSITLHEDKQPGARFRVLAKTTNRGKRDTRPEIDLGLLNPPPQEGTVDSFILAASVEGTLTSAFGKGKSQKPARVLLIASSSLLANPFVRVGFDEGALALATPYANSMATTGILVAKNVFDWLSYEENLGGCLVTLSKRDEPKKKN